MKKQFFKIFLTIVATTIGMVSCQKDILPEQKQAKKNGNYVKNNDAINEVRIVFAKTLAVAMRDDELRKYIHKKMQERYTSNYEMVYILEKDKIVYNGKKLSEILASTADPSVFETYGKDFFNSIVEIDPLIAIGMPELESFTPATWKVNYIPSVVAILEESPKNSNKTRFF